MNFTYATYGVCRFCTKYDDMCNICVYIEAYVLLWLNEERTPEGLIRVIKEV
jgi:hypothetical protein